MDECEFSCPFDFDDVNASDSLLRYVDFFICFTVSVPILHSLLKKYVLLVLMPSSFSIELVVTFEALTLCEKYLMI